jgi:cytochrome c-type biogenesis protein CcmH/NrfG
LRVNPRSSDGWSHLALYRAKTNQKGEAIRAAQEASRFAPNDVAINYYLAIVYHLAGDRPQALRWLKRAMTKGYPRNEVRADPEWNDWRNDPEFIQCVGNE